MRVEAKGPILIASPVNRIVPVKRLHEAFPATRPTSGKASVALPPGNAGVPARSTSTQSVPGNETVEDVFGLLAFGLLEEAHEPSAMAPKLKSKKTKNDFTKILLSCIPSAAE